MRYTIPKYFIILLLLSLVALYKLYKLATVFVFRENFSAIECNITRDPGDSVKMITFWGTFYGGSALPDYCIMDDHSMDFCPHKCTYRTDDCSATVSDAVVIHGRDRVKLPNVDNRPENQRWIFLMFESQIYSYFNITTWNKIFNWTMTYRRDSDIPIKYGRLQMQPTPAKNLSPSPSPIRDEIKATLKHKKLAAWAVSNCRSTDRLSLVKYLKKFVDIDIYGACGNLTCAGKGDQCEKPQMCHELLGTRYKFYLAFENSVCQNYITEKFFNALEYGLVPVVNGFSREDYEAVAPKNSFIHVGDFGSVQDLAEHLLFLDGNDEEYLKYFEWRDMFTLEHVYYFQKSWCDLCTKLYEADTNLESNFNHTLTSTMSTYESIHKWWFGDEHGSNYCKMFNLQEDGKYYFL